MAIRLSKAFGPDAAWAFSPAFRGTPIRQQGMEAGSFVIADKADGETFTVEDEEVLALFASQVTAAIAGRRTAPTRAARMGGTRAGR